MPTKTTRNSKVSSPASSPQPSRPIMKNYGIAKDKKGLLPWEHVTSKMKAARNYWIASTRPDGRPHVMPVWGFWMAPPAGGAERFYFGSDGSSRKARNIAQNAAVVVHLESADDLVILEGRAQEIDVRADAALLAALDKASRAKYDMPMFLPPGAVMFEFQPHKAFGWREKDFPKSATRWLLR